jgi:hypothetical protein
LARPHRGGRGDGVVIDHGAPDAFVRYPGTAGYDANLHLLQTFGIGGNERPTIGAPNCLPPRA